MKSENTLGATAFPADSQQKQANIGTFGKHTLKSLMIVDSHCHLDFPDFAAERDAVIARAFAAGIGTMLTICTRLDQFAGVRAIAEANPRIWCSVGAHPHEAADHADMLPSAWSRLPRIRGSSASARPGSISTTT